MPQLTKNFHSNEICKNVAYESLPPRSQGMVQAMAEMLQKIRDKLNKPITVTGGNRSLADYDRLKKQGLNPSSTSDHFFGLTVPLTPGTSAYAKYGTYYDMSVGACDIVCNGMETTEFFNFILNMRYSGELITGQLLLEKNNTFWVHIANDPAKFLNASQISKRGEWSVRGIGYSLDNGVNFTVIPWGKLYGGMTAAKGEVSHAVREVTTNVTAYAAENPVKTTVAVTITVAGVAVVMYIALRPKKGKRL